jgi:hypothetical protein
VGGNSGYRKLTFEKEREMAYKLIFLGLAHFYDKGRDGKLVLMPDGTDPRPLNVWPHNASFFVQNKDIIDSSHWWQPIPDPVLTRLEVTEFRVMHSSRITMTGLDNTGNPGCWPFGDSRLDAAKHRNLPELENDSKRALKIVPEWADTIAQLAIRQGTLESFLFGGLVRGAGVSRLTVTKQGPIVILALPADGSRFRMLKLRDNTDEIVFANTSNLLKPHADKDSHFRLYGRLDVNRRDETLKDSPPIPVLDPLVFSHPLLKHIQETPITVPNVDCSNSCC